jgi:hypothetical protein
MLRILFPGVLVTLLLVAGSSRAEGRRGRVDFRQAFELAQQQVPGGQLVKARVENKGPQGRLFGFYFWWNGRILEIEVTPVGKIYKKRDSGDPKDRKDIPGDVLQLLQKRKGRVKLPTGRLLEIAAENLRGSALSGLTYERRGDGLVVKIGDLVLDADTGKVLSGGKK